MSCVPVIVLEFNELTPSLMFRFIEAGRLPSFARLFRESAAFITDAEERAPYLEPWIQWVTCHTGLKYAQHGIFDLGDGHKLTKPRLWEILSGHGAKVWVCGSMNAAFHAPVNGFILPDPWSTGIEPYPPGEFEIFFDYVRRNVQEHSRDRMPVGLGDHLRFLRFMASHGLSPGTIAATVMQILTERWSASRWRRAMIMDRMQWDVFEHYWNREKPDYSTFFLNSTAHFQHMYWRNMEPDLFEVKPEQQEQDEYGGAVRFGYESMDAIVGKALKIAGNRATVVLISALGQQPCTIYEGIGGKIAYRMLDPGRFFAFAGIAGSPRYAPVMTEQFHLYCADAAEAERTASHLRELRMNDGRAVMFVKQEGAEIFAGCTVFGQVEKDATVVNRGGETKPFDRLFYQISGMKSGMHHPEGLLWIREPGRDPVRHDEPVPLSAFAPTLLSLFGIPPTEDMAEPLAGFGLARTQPV